MRLETNKLIIVAGISRVMSAGIIGLSQSAKKSERMNIRRSFLK